MAGMVTMPRADQILPGRAQSMVITESHRVLARAMMPPFPAPLAQVAFGMGCFWGAERLFWQQAGVYVTAVGYGGGATPNPSYREVCSGLTGHSEVVRVVYDPAKIMFDQLLALFWQHHDPTQGMRQGNDIGTQYRSVIHCQSQQQLQQADDSRQRYQQCLTEQGRGQITTEIVMQENFYYAELEHQQYLAKNPRGYCGLAGCGVDFPA